MALKEFTVPLWTLMSRRANNVSFKEFGVIFLRSSPHQLRRHFGSSIGFHREKQLLRHYQRLQVRILQAQSGLRHQSTTAPTSTSGSGILGISDQVLKSSQAKDEGGSKGQSQEDEEEKKQKENAARALKYSLYGLGSMILATGVYVFVVWGTPLRDDEGREIRDEFSDQNVVSQYFNRSVSELSNYVTALKEPSREKLLPDPVKMPYYQPPYTLLLEITGVLVHPEWTYKTGWRFKKRPGVEYFLKQLHATQLFEIVIYTQESGFTGVPIVQALDTPQVVLYQLFRDSTKYVDGHHLKDLDRVNRDLSKVIMVDCNPEVVKNHRNNALVLPRWNGNDDDRTLFDLASLLQTITSIDVGDVREILNHYTNYADPIAEFREKRRLLMEQQEERDRMLLSSLKKTPGGGFNFIPSFFRRS